MKSKGMALKNIKNWANKCMSSWQKFVDIANMSQVQLLKLFERWTTRWDKVPLSYIKMNKTVLTGRGSPQRGCTETVLVQVKQLYYFDKSQKTSVYVFSLISSRFI